MKLKSAIYGSDHKDVTYGPHVVKSSLEYYILCYPPVVL